MWNIYRDNLIVDISKNEAVSSIQGTKYGYGMKVVTEYL